MNAIVLSGGGAKGSYHIGVWKALRRLNFKYKIVTGTSAGALNAAFMVQKEYHMAHHLWKNMDYDFVFEKEIINRKDFLKKYVSDITNLGGINIKNLESNVKKYVKPEKFFKSNIDFGLITYNLSNLNEEKIKKSDLSKDNIVDYLVASSSAFPAFPTKQIDGKSYIDGGYYDVLPINLAIELGATNIIAVDLKSIGIKKKPKKNVDITYIVPNNSLGPFFGFNKKYTRKNINFGYNDTLKVFNVYEGKRYTFKKSNLMNKFKGNKTYKNYDNFLKTIDYLMETFDYEEDNVYIFNKIIFEIRDILEKHDIISAEYIINMIKKNKWKKLLDSKYILKHIYMNPDDKIAKSIFKKEAQAINFLKYYEEKK